MTDAPAPAAPAAGPPRSIATPCVKVCMVDATEGQCLGCGRSLREIAAWTRFTDAERAEIIAALPARQAAVDARLAAKARRPASAPAP